MMRVDVRGTIYETVAEAAEENNVSTWVVYKMVALGHPERIGRPLKKKKKIDMAGVAFDSISDLARFIGKDVSHTRRALKAGPRARANLEKRVRQAVGMF